MKYPLLFSLASPESPSSSVSTETVVTILHIHHIRKTLEVWQSAALEYEKANPSVRIQFDYLARPRLRPARCRGKIVGWGAASVGEAASLNRVLEK